jgi:hypothetical protein
MDKMLFTRDALIAWLRTQPADKEYIWSDPVFCLMGQYLADNASCWGAFSYSDMPDYYKIAQTKPWKFGAALKRAEALQRLPSPATVPLITQESDNEAAAPVLAQRADQLASAHDRPYSDADV